MLHGTSIWSSQYGNLAPGNLDASYASKDGDEKAAAAALQERINAEQGLPAL